MYSDSRGLARGSSLGVTSFTPPTTGTNEPSGSGWIQTATTVLEWGKQIAPFLTGHSKEPERIQANNLAYQTARFLGPAGDAALKFLEARKDDTGQLFNVPGVGQIGGWATDSARNDAEAKYDQIIRNGRQPQSGSTTIYGPGGQPITLPPGSISGATIALAAGALFLLARPKRGR